MSLPKLPRSLFLLLAFGACLLGDANAASTVTKSDFSGVWQLNEHTSDTANDITTRLHAEQKKEAAAASHPAGASSTAAPASNPLGHGGGHGMGGGMGGHGGGGMGGGGGGMGGGRHGGGSHDYVDQSTDSDKPKIPAPPLLANDSLLNVQQDAHSMQVDFNNSDRLDTRFDGATHQSLNGDAMVQTQLSGDSMQVSMQFTDGTTLEQTWVRSADGKQLTLTESWKTVDLKEPIVFQRKYDRLDL